MGADLSLRQEMSQSMFSFLQSGNLFCDSAEQPNRRGRFGGRFSLLGPSHQRCLTAVGAIS
jgi:hypothetical protein